MFALLALAACGDDRAVPAKGEEPLDVAVPTPTRPPPEPPSKEEMAVSQEAARVLQTYYELIGARDYEAAARLRSDEDTDPERLAANFRPYERYEVQLGAPGRPVRAGGFLFVDMSVMITGAFKGGKSFGSVGRVTMRRPVEGGDGGWRVYTG